MAKHAHTPPAPKDTHSNVLAFPKDSVRSANPLRGTIEQEMAILAQLQELVARLKARSARRGAVVPMGRA